MKFEIDDKSLNLIAQALGQMPYAVAAPLIADLQQQIDVQKVEPPTPVTVKPPRRRHPA
jgi:hypothetical protein